MENSILNNQDVVKRVIEYYHSSIKSKPKLLNFLLDKNNITNEELEIFQIGSADGSIANLISSKGIFREKVRETNLINQRGRETMRGYITFPVIDGNGFIQDVIGYKYKFFKEKDSNRIKYLNEEPFVKIEKENIREIIKALSEIRTKQEEEPKLENDVYLQYGERTYRIRGLNDYNLNRLRINIKVTQNEKSHIDIVDLYSSQSRNKLIIKLTELFEEEAEKIRKEIERLIEDLDKIRVNNSKKKKKNPEKLITKKDKSSIIEILNTENLLKMTEEDLTRIGIAGEEKNKVMLYMVFTSRKLKKPLSVVVKGDSAGGKSYLVSNVLKLFPDEDIKNFTEISAKSLFYMTEDELEHKILVIFERHGREASDYSIRSLQSEDRLKIAVTMRDPKTNEFRTMEKTVYGPISYVETSTLLTIHPENATRMFDLNIDESDNQTKKIYGVQNREYLPEKKNKDDEIARVIQKHKLIQRLLKPVKVKIPYVELIEFPTNKLRLRRDRMRFLALIETFAFLYQYQREEENINNERYIIADIEDYKMAYELAEDIMAETLSVLHKNSRKLLEIICIMNKKDFTISDLQERIEWTSLKIRRYIKQLIDEDHLERKSCGQGKRAVYSLCSNKKANPTKLEGLPTPKQLKEKLYHFIKGNDKQVNPQNIDNRSRIEANQ